MRLTCYCITFCISCCKVRPGVGPSWSWSYGSWIYNNLCNQCPSPLTLWVRIPLMRGVLDTTLCDKVCQWLATGRWFSPGTSVSSTIKTDCHDIAEILLKVALNTIKTNKQTIVIDIRNIMDLRGGRGYIQKITQTGKNPSHDVSTRFNTQIQAHP